nr:MAG TPA: hypothetical protein [Caudoviricetes sp.]
MSRFNLAISQFVCFIYAKVQTKHAKKPSIHQRVNRRKKCNYLQIRILIRPQNYFAEIFGGIKTLPYLCIVKRGRAPAT